MRGGHTRGRALWAKKQLPKPKKVPYKPASILTGKILSEQDKSHHKEKTAKPGRSAAWTLVRSVRMNTRVFTGLPLAAYNGKCDNLRKVPGKGPHAPPERRDMF